MTYSYLDNFMGAYLNQDYALSGSDLESIVKTFREHNPEASTRGLRDDVARFRHEHEATLDLDFRTQYEAELDISAWGHDARSFLERIDQLLRE